VTWRLGSIDRKPHDHVAVGVDEHTVPGALVQEQELGGAGHRVLETRCTTTVNEVFT
jgi:hypothetical protein